MLADPLVNEFRDLDDPGDPQKKPQRDEQGQAQADEAERSGPR